MPAGCQQLLGRRNGVPVHPPRTGGRHRPLRGVRQGQPTAPDDLPHRRTTPATGRPVWSTWFCMRWRRSASLVISGPGRANRRSGGRLRRAPTGPPDRPELGANFLVMLRVDALAGQHVLVVGVEDEKPAGRWGVRSCGVANAYAGTLLKKPTAASGIWSKQCRKSSGPTSKK